MAADTLFAVPTLSTVKKPLNSVEVVSVVVLKHRISGLGRYNYILGSKAGTGGVAFLLDISFPLVDLLPIC
jgi:hypothetical protein